MCYLLKWIKFSVKKINIKKNTGKMAKNTGKVGEKSGNFVSPDKWEPCLRYSIPILYEGCQVSALFFAHF